MNTPPVFVNGRFLTQPLSGMQRYAEEILTAVDRELARGASQKPPGQWIVLVPTVNHRSPPWQHLHVRAVGRTRGHLWEQLELPFYSRRGPLVSLTGAGPLWHGEHVLCLHDAGVFAHPEHFSKAYGTWHRFLRPRLARRAKILLTISEFSRRELARYCSIPHNKFHIVPDSAEHILQVEPDLRILKRAGLQPGRYILCVGNRSPNKNVALAIEAFTKLAPEGYRLAVAGGGVEAIFGTVSRAVGQGVIALGRVTDEELRALYENAAVFLFPSRYEGFGVPPLEALALGCPVLSSDSSAMPEVLGDAAVFFKSNDADHLETQLSKILIQEDLRNFIIPTGNKRAQLYSWRTSAARLLRLLGR